MTNKHDQSYKDGVIHGVCIALISLVGIAVIYNIPRNYDYSINGVFDGPDFELSLTEGMLMGNYRITGMIGNYGALSIRETLPSKEACLQNVDIRREAGSLLYSGVNEGILRIIKKADLDKCIVRINQYLTKVYGNQVDNRDTYRKQ